MDEFIDPISGEFFSDPVLAEDGYFYELTEIHKLLRIESERISLSYQTLVMGIRSPRTGEMMGPTLIRSFQFTKDLNEYLKENNMPFKPLTEYRFGLLSIDEEAELDEKLLVKLINENSNLIHNLFRTFEEPFQRNLIRKYNLSELYLKRN